MLFIGLQRPAYPATKLAIQMELYGRPSLTFHYNLGPTFTQPWKSITLIPVDNSISQEELPDKLFKQPWTIAKKVRYGSDLDYLECSNGITSTRFLIWTVTIEHQHELTAYCIINMALHIINQNPTPFYNEVPNPESFETTYPTITKIPARYTWNLQVCSMWLFPNYEYIDIRSISDDNSFLSTTWRITPPTTQELIFKFEKMFTSPRHLTPTAYPQYKKNNMRKMMGHTLNQQSIHEELKDKMKDRKYHPSIDELVSIGLKRINEPWKFEKELEKGGFSSIFLASSKKSKIVIKKTTNKSHAKYLLREAAFLHLLSSHQSIIRAHAIDDPEIAIPPGEKVQEIRLALTYKNGGDLLDLIRSHRSWLTEAFIQTVAKKMVGAVSWCHSKGIAHRDIKPENILFDIPTNEFSSNDKIALWVSNTACLADFGLAEIIDEKRLHSKCGTTDYAAPEIIKPAYKLYKLKPADIWATGAVIYAAFNQNHPYNSRSNPKSSLDLRTKRNKQHFQELGSFSRLELINASEHAKGFIRDCCTIDPEQRPSSDDLKKTPWLNPTPRKRKK